jgi:thiamine-phosphate pyrophosphorylase
VKLRGLYAITPDGPDVMQKVQQALEGGIALLQYRRKGFSREFLLQEARQMHRLAQRHQVPFIVNDDLELALALGADGVHLGREDGELAAARRKLKGKLIGASCYDRLDLAQAALAAGADYIAFGSVFPSPTKPSAARASLSLFGNGFEKPVCAIGGITLQNAPQVIAAGADLVAVISDLFDAPDIARQAAAYRKLFP